MTGYRVRKQLAADVTAEGGNGPSLSPPQPCSTREVEQGLFRPRQADNFASPGRVTDGKRHAGSRPPVAKLFSQRGPTTGYLGCIDMRPPAPKMAFPSQHICMRLFFNKATIQTASLRRTGVSLRAVNQYFTPFIRKLRGYHYWLQYYLWFGC